MVKDYGGYDALDYLRELFENHDSCGIVWFMQNALWNIADNHQDGAPDAGNAAHICTHIASLLRQDLDAEIDG